MFDDVFDELVAVEAAVCHLQACKLALLGRLVVGTAARHNGDLGAVQTDFVREELACALRLSSSSAAFLLGLARECLRLPQTMDALERGAISMRHVELLAESVAGLDDENAAAIETRVVPGAESISLVSFRRRVQRTVLAIDPARDQAAAHAVTQRRVAHSPQPHGMGAVWAVLPADGSLTVLAGIDHVARAIRLSDDDRSADQLRADALVHMAGCALAGTPASDPAPVAARPHIQIVVTAQSLAGACDEPAELDGHGPISAMLARQIAGDPSGTWRRLITDRSGQLLDYGRRTYRPPAPLAAHVIARDRTCRFPGCNRRAARCDLDHVRAWQDGGTTDAANLQALCRRHHRLKHDGGWQASRCLDGATTWTAPTGRVYRKPAERYLGTADPPAA